LLRVATRVVIIAAIAVLALAALLYFRQHDFIYHPRPYDTSYAHALPPGAEEIRYALPFGKQVAFYIPAHDRPVPERVWVAFCGNASLALDWTTILAGYPRNGDAFLLVDYPGYGKCAGYATIATTRASADEALKRLAQRLGIAENDIELCAIGHSLGAAVALDFAARHRAQRVVALAPFTTLRNAAARVVGGALSQLLIESYDNGRSIEEIHRSYGETQITIFHGTNDRIVPFAMGQELARLFPFVAFFPVQGAGHVSVLGVARERIIRWMSSGAGQPKAEGYGRALAFRTAESRELNSGALPAVQASKLCACSRLQSLTSLRTGQIAALWQTYSQ
jgi:pimeloyl-ACP methyl ester carboxylesterase